MGGNRAAIPCHGHNKVWTQDYSKVRVSRIVLWTAFAIPLLHRSTPSVFLLLQRQRRLFSTKTARDMPFKLPTLPDVPGTDPSRAVLDSFKVAIAKRVADALPRAHVVFDVVVAGRAHMKFSRVNRENQHGPMLGNKCLFSLGPMVTWCAYCSYAWAQKVSELSVAEAVELAQGDLQPLAHMASHRPTPIAVSL